MTLLRWFLNGLWSILREIGDSCLDFLKYLIDISGAIIVTAIILAVLTVVIANSPDEHMATCACECAVTAEIAYP